MKKVFLFVALHIAAFLLIGIPSFAQTGTGKDYVRIQLMPNHDDWNYQLGEKPIFTLSVIRHNVKMKNIEVEYEWGYELNKPEIKKTINIGATGEIILKLDGSRRPGFKTLLAYTYVDGVKYTNFINVGFEPLQITPTTKLPKDFTEFWKNALDEARALPLNTLITPMPELNTPFAKVYQVRFQNNHKDSYMYGILSVPSEVESVTAEGSKRYPVMLAVPGAGVYKYNGDKSFFPEKGVITFQIGIHGIPQDAPQEMYYQLNRSPLYNYSYINSDDPDTYYYKRVYVGCVKALDMLSSLPIVDTTRMGVYGGSQGGLLTLVVAGLDHRVYCASAAYPAMSEIAGAYHGRSEGWPHMFTDLNPVKNNVEDKVRVSEYYDAVNFARFVQCPIYFIQGYNDRTCCPTSTFSAYNMLTCEKELLLPLDCGHWLYKEQLDKRNEWLLNRLTK